MQNTVGERIKEMRKALGLSQTELARQADVWVGTINRFEHGLQKPGLEFLQTITSKLGVSAAWLLNGKGQMFVDIASTDKSDADMRELIEFLHVHPEQKQLLLDVMRVQKKAIEGVDAIARPPRRLRPHAA